MDDQEVPILWHLKVSNYNEKARWALDYKGVPHVRRAVDAGPPPAVAQRSSPAAARSRSSSSTAR